LLLITTPAVWSADVGSLDEYRNIIATRCTSCHEAGRIEQAMIEGRNLGEILNKMQQMGAELTPRDRSVLGIFWGSPLKESKK
jgi:hypothetical protein